ncbi:MAG: D-alanyl-D-alanine carboxypeptidase family protein [Oscillospiraceae bacterium]
MVDLCKRAGVTALIIIFTFLFAFSSNAEEPLDISAHSAILMVADTGEIIYEKNSNEKMPMASTTKIMSSIIALECGKSEQLLKISSDMVNIEGTSMGLMPDDVISVKTLVCGMLLESGNDAANAVAYAVAGSTENFVKLMNDKAKEIEMTSTHFVTPSGLDEKEHYSTARDMALLGAYAIKNPEFKHICSQKEMTVCFGNPPFKRKISNHNRLLSNCEGVFGIKTGFTKKSGRCLVSAAKRDGINLIAVTLNAPNDWNDHSKMFDYGFSVIHKNLLDLDVSTLKIKVVGSDKKEIQVATHFEYFYPYLNLSAVPVKDIFISKFIYAPVKTGDVVGYIRYSVNNKTLFETPIIATEDAICVTKENAVQSRKGFLEKIKEKIVKGLKGENND